MKIKAILFVLCLTMIFSASSFAFDFEVEWAASVNTAITVDDVTDIDGIRYGILKIKNNDIVSHDISKLELTTGAASTAIAALHSTISLYKDVAPRDGIVYDNDVLLVGAVATGAVTALGTDEIVFALAPALTIAPGATEHVIVVVNSLAASVAA